MSQSRPDLDAALQPDDPRIRAQLLSMIVQYLEDSGLYASALNLRDEVRYKVACDVARSKQLVRIRGAVVTGDWTNMEHFTAKLCTNPSLLYRVLRHRFYELLAQGDTATALQFLATRLREHRVHEDVPGDFDRLCLTIVEAASPSQSAQLPDVQESRTQILAAIDRELKACTTPLIEQAPPPKRLLQVLGQAVEFQFGKFPPSAPVETLIRDYHPPVVPAPGSVALPRVHRGSVRSLAFVPGTNTLLSGSCDRTVVVWDTANKQKLGRLKGHEGRVWTIAAGRENAVTGSSDGTVRLWSVSEKTELAVFRGHEGDVYSVAVEGGMRHIVSGGYDQSVIVWDTPTQSAEATLKGHSGSVTAVLVDRSGKTIVSGGNDLTLQLWDARSCLATGQLTPILREVTSLSADSTFTRILAATQDNTNRIWDLRMTDSVVVLKGHQNSSKHFVKARFGPGDKTVIGGSDDGKIYIWDAATGQQINTLRAHAMGVFDIAWSSHSHCFASCGEDTDVLLWGPSAIQ